MKPSPTPLRRLALLLGALALSAGAASCARGKEAKPLIGVSLQGSTAPFAASCRAAMERSAEGRAQLAVTNGQAEGELAAIEKLMGRGAKVLAVAPASASGAAAVIGLAKARNVPLVLLGEEPRIEDLRSWDKVIFVGHSASRAGLALAELLAAAWGSVPGADRDRDGGMRLAFVGLAPSVAEDERAQACVEALRRAGLRVESLSVHGAAAIAALGSRPGARVEAVVADDEASAAAAADALGAGGKGRPPLPVLAFTPWRSPPSPAELAGLRLAGAVSGDPAAIGDAALDAAYALAFGRDPTEAGFELADGKSLILPYAEARSPGFDPAKK